MKPSACTIAEVRAACERQDVRKVKGFGERTEQRILEGIRTFLTRSTRALLSEALATSDLLAAFLRGSSAVEDVVLVGEARRRVETVDRIELAARAREGAGTDSVAEHFLRYPGFAMVEREPLRGRLAGGLPVELHVPPRERFSDEVLALTGAEHHV